MEIQDNNDSPTDNEDLRHAWESGAWVPCVSILSRLSSQTVPAALLLADASVA
jgi:hypothetical protein